MTAKKSKSVTIRRGDGTVHVDLVPADFFTLHAIADRAPEIKTIEKQYRKLQKAGLVRHEFVQDDGAWPKAIAHLTQEGEQALAQEFS
jgi:hypothetical protein